MATKARFISPSKIKQEAFVDENVDEKYLSNTILYAQELYTKEMLGTALYDAIEAEILAGSLSSDNSTLLTSYIQPALKWWVISEVMDLLHVKITNKGIVIKNSDNSESVSPSYIVTLKEKFRNLAERWDDKTRRFLLQNQTTYPLYLNAGSGIDTIHPKGNTYGTGWYLGDSWCDDCDENLYK